MKLWVLRRPYGSVDYDEYDAFVVRAETEEQARMIAQEQERQAGPVFMTVATCSELTADGEAGVVLGSFNAG